jgi:hypothetical protein
VLHLISANVSSSILRDEFHGHGTKFKKSKKKHGFSTVYGTDIIKYSKNNVSPLETLKICNCFDFCNKLSN